MPGNRECGVQWKAGLSAEGVGLSEDLIDERQVKKPRSNSQAQKVEQGLMEIRVEGSIYMRNHCLISVELVYSGMMKTVLE